MNGKRIQILDIRPGEWTLVIFLTLLLAFNTLVLELADVVATAGFVSNIGPESLPLLWILDMAITLVSAGIYALIVDRVQRVRLMKWLLGLLAGFYFLVMALFSMNAPDWLTYPLLYIVNDQQFIIFPLAFWTLANDYYNTAEAKRLFPIIGVGFALGSVLGNALAAILASLGFGQKGSMTPILLVAGSIFVVAFLFFWIVFKNRPPHARQEGKSFSFKETFKVGADYLRNVPAFHYLSIAMAFAGFTLTVIEFHFIQTIQQSYSSATSFQIFLGTYKSVLIICLFLGQGLITGKLLSRIPLKNAFVVLPFTLIISVALAIIWPGLLGIALSRFFARLIERIWDEPSRKAIQGMVPDERRGRVSAFFDSNFFALATIIGSLIITGLIAITNSGWISKELSQTIYLVLAGLAGIGALWASWRLHQVFDQSLLNWRFSRARRKSVLDDIEF